MPSRLLSRPRVVATQLWRQPIHCSTTRAWSESKPGKPLGYNAIHTETVSGVTDESRLSPDEFHRTASRHVLRGILRECTYLPDQFAASWIRQHAISRFRTYESRNKGHKGDEEYEKRLETVRRKSRQAMYQLQRANEGDRKMLLKALSMAYGRIGKRRRELLQPLLRGSDEKLLQEDGDFARDETTGSLGNSLGPGLSSATSTGAHHERPDKKQADTPVKAKVKAYVSDLPVELRSLVQSQISASPPTIARRNPRRLGVEIPELNSWYKPMPDIRVKNKLNEWYASLLSSVQPPLPHQEWEHLRDLALGVTRAQSPILRRTNFTPSPSLLEIVVTRGKLPDRLFRKDYAHKVTPRFMQRLWAEVFSQSPLMNYDSGSDKWNVTWGHHVLQDSKNDRKIKVTAVQDHPKVEDKR